MLLLDSPVGGKGVNFVVAFRVRKWPFYLQSDEGTFFHYDVIFSNAYHILIAKSLSLLAKRCGRSQSSPGDKMSKKPDPGDSKANLDMTIASE